MMLRLVNLLLVSLYALLWIGGAVSHFLWQETPSGANWTASAYLASAAALLLLNIPGSRWWLAAVGTAGFAAEVAGSRLGLIFGSYSYSGVLQPQLAGVPLVIGCAWVILLSYVKSLLAVLRLRLFAAVCAGALWMTVIDLAIDPVATQAVGYWQWHDPGWYYSVPLSNFVGWVLVSAALLGSGATVHIEGGFPRWIGFSVVAFFGALATAHGMLAPAIVALALCCWQLWLELKRRQPRISRRCGTDRFCKKRRHGEPSESRNPPCSQRLAVVPGRDSER